MSESGDINDGKQPFNEWCEKILQIQPSSLISLITSVIDSSDENELWDFASIGIDTESIGNVDPREYCVSMLDRMKINDTVEVLEMDVLHAFVETLRNGLILKELMTSDWIEQFEGGERSLVIAAIGIMMRAEERKLHICMMENGPTDLTTSVFYQYFDNDGNFGGTHIAELSDAYHDENADVYARLADCMMWCRLDFGKPGMIAVVSDSLIRETFIDDPEIYKKAESIKSDFENFIDTDVNEAVTLILACPMFCDSLCFIHSVYGYDDEGLPTFRPDGRSIQLLDRSIFSKDPSHRGKIGVMVNDFILENQGF